MSIFKDSAIVIKVTKKQEKEFIYNLMSEKFGKIIAVRKLSKKEKSIDIGYYINYEIDVRNEQKVNTLKNIKILKQFEYENKRFDEINEFLQMINLIMKKIVLGVENIKINEIVKDILVYNKKDLEIKMILAQIKILNILGELKIENNNIITEKILKFIDKNDFKNIIKLSGVKEEQKKELKSLLKLKANIN